MEEEKSGIVQWHAAQNVKVSARDHLLRLLPKIVEFLPFGTRFGEVSKAARAATAHLPLKRFGGEIIFPEGMSIDDKNHIIIALKSIQRYPWGGWKQLTLQQLFQGLTNTRSHNHAKIMEALITACRTDSALAAHVMQTNLLQDILPEEEKIAYQNNLLSKCLGIIPGIAGAIIKILHYLLWISLSLFMSAFMLLIAFTMFILSPLLACIGTGGGDKNLGKGSCKIALYAVCMCINFLTRIVAALCFLIPSMLYSIYAGCTLGAERAFTRFELLCFDSFPWFPPKEEANKYFPRIFPENAKYFERVEKETIVQLAQRHAKKYGKILNRLNSSYVYANEKLSAVAPLGEEKNRAPEYYDEDFVYVEDERPAISALPYHPYASQPAGSSPILDATTDELELIEGAQESCHEEEAFPSDVADSYRTSASI